MALIIDITKVKENTPNNKREKVLQYFMDQGRYGKPVDDNYISGWRGNYKYSGGGILLIKVYTY